MINTKKYNVILLLFLASCSIFKPTRKVTYPNGASRVVLTIPKGYTMSKFNFESVRSYGYKYRDSSIIFITDEGNGGINYNNINQAGKKDSLFYKFVEKDTIFLNGMDSKGLHWRFNYYGNFGVGYKNVSEQRKAEFEKALNSIVVK